jgi:hypothetical protein
MCGLPEGVVPIEEQIEQAKRDLQAAVRGDDIWRHPDIYPDEQDMVWIERHRAHNERHADDNKPTIQSLVVKDIEEREEHGIRTYGRAIYADTPNDPVEGGPIGQAYRESLDQAIYLRWYIERYGTGDALVFYAISAIESGELDSHLDQLSNAIRERQGQI